MEKNGSLYVRERKGFKPTFVINEYVEKSVKWAFSQKHFHDDEEERTPRQKKCDATQGKIGEFAVYKMLKDYGVSGFSKVSKSFKARVSLGGASFIKEEVIVTPSGEGIMVQTAKLNVKGQEDPSVPRKDITSKLNSSVLEDLKTISNALRTATTFTLN